MDIDQTTDDLAMKLWQLRTDRGMSQLHLADQAGVKASVVNRAERGRDTQISTWKKLFRALGYRLLFDVIETSEDYGEYLAHHAELRRQRRREGLLTGKRRF